MNDDLLNSLESEAIFIIREALANAEKPVLLYSIGKDSSVLLHLAKKAFYPSAIPFTLLHIDTTWKFKEMIQFRDKVAKEESLNLIIHTNPNGIKDNITPFNTDRDHYTMVMKTEALKQALDEHQFDVILCGARRDEDPARAKERIFSFRNDKHHWDVKNQRPEFWQNYNAMFKPGESMRVFPLSNWTEIDIWQYIQRENIDIVPLYFAKERPVIKKDGQLIMVDDKRIPLEGKPEKKMIRFRSLGCYPLSSAILSEADSLEKLIEEMRQIKTSERKGRLIDKSKNASMEKKKQEGYF